ncbi:conserved hypothetical protein [Ricinus communis]|uniref:Uncharacterized protein n=1 Tax=Ricinus communis TaxID=3988 RepID=B9RBX8_RICCO|nr:conserved hypothetical protein [Ricinus communis]
MQALNLRRKFEMERMLEMENVKEFTDRLMQITLPELLNALEALEQRRAYKQNGLTEGAFFARQREASQSNMQRTRQNEYVK